MEKEESEAVIKIFDMELKKTLHQQGAIKHSYVVKCLAKKPSFCEDYVAWGTWVISIRSPSAEKEKKAKEAAGAAAAVGGGRV